MLFEHAGYRSVAFALALLTFAALLTRVPYITTPALWIDEAFSTHYAAKGFGAIWGDDWRLDPTPPAYYSLLAAWERLFGMTEPALRALSLVLTCITAANLLFTGMVFGSVRGGALGSLIWLLTPLSMEYSLEIRAYALEHALLTGVLLAAAALLKRYDRDPRGLRALAPSALWLILLALSTFYTHVTSIFAIIGVSFSLLGYFVFKQDARGIAMWFVASALFLLGAAPQIMASYHVVTRNSEALAWLPPGTLSWMIWTMRALFIGEIAAGAATKSILFTAWAAGLLNGYVRIRRDRAAVALLVIAPACGLLLLVIFSFFVPVLLPRTIMWIGLPLSLLAGLGLAQLRTSVAYPVLVTSIIGLLFVAHENMLRRMEWRSDYRGLESIRQRDADPLLVTVDGERACIMEDYGIAQQNVRLLDLEAEQAFARTQRVELACNHPPEIRVGELRAILASGRPIWIVGSTDPSDERRIEVVKLSRLLDGAAHISEHIDQPGFYAARFVNLP